MFTPYHFPICAAEYYPFRDLSPLLLRTSDRGNSPSEFTTVDSRPIGRSSSSDPSPDSSSIRSSASSSGSVSSSVAGSSSSSSVDSTDQGRINDSCSRETDLRLGSVLGLELEQIFVCGDSHTVPLSWSLLPPSNGDNDSNRDSDSSRTRTRDDSDYSVCGAVSNCGDDSVTGQYKIGNEHAAELQALRGSTEQRTAVGVTGSDNALQSLAGDASAGEDRGVGLDRDLHVNAHVNVNVSNGGVACHRGLVSARCRVLIPKLVTGQSQLSIIYADGIYDKLRSEEIFLHLS